MAKKLTDFLSTDSISLAKSPQFQVLLRELHPYTVALEREIVAAAARGESLETIRYHAGRLSGAQYFHELLKQVKEVADATK